MKVLSLLHLWPDELRAVLDPSLDFVAVDPDDHQRRDAELRDANVVITTRFDRDMARVARSLQLIICPAAGTEEIDRAAIPDGAIFVNSRGPEISIAEYVIGALVALRQGFLQADRALRRGEWLHGFLNPERFVGEVYGSALGLVGYGHIGQEIAKRAVGFGIDCRAVTLHPQRGERGFDGVQELGDLKDSTQVDRLATWSDALIICCELSPLTRGLIDARRLALMKPSAVLINVARGAIVVEKDLYEALRDRRIAGAALDVWYRYPQAEGEPTLPSAYPFHELDNVLMTPHSSGWTLPHKQRKLALWAQIINEFARTGRVPTLS